MKVITRDARTGKRTTYNIREIRPSYVKRSIHRDDLDEREDCVADADPKEVMNEDTINFVNDLIKAGITSKEVIKLIQTAKDMGLSSSSFAGEEKEAKEDKDGEDKDVEDKDEDGEDKDEEDLDEDEETEEVEDLGGDDKKAKKDSFRSIGSLVKDSVTSDTSMNPGELAEADAWNKRFNGGK